jgi:hypothetical protein
LAAVWISVDFALGKDETGVPVGDGSARLSQLLLWKSSAGDRTRLDGGQLGGGSIHHFPEDAVPVATA